MDPPPPLTCISYGNKAIGLRVFNLGDVIQEKPPIKDCTDLHLYCDLNQHACIRDRKKQVLDWHLFTTRSLTTKYALIV
jgi:hypothetical protein